MKTFPLPLVATGIAGLLALPFSVAGALLLGLTAGLGAIIWADYTARYRGLPLPRRQLRRFKVVFRAPPLCTEPNRLAA